MRWCYLEENKHEGCADLSGDPGSYWSWSACYPYRHMRINDCSTTEYLDQDENRLVLTMGEVCLSSNSVTLRTGTGTVGTANFYQGK